MRIAVLSNTAWYLFNFRLNLMLELQKAGHEVLAVAPFDSYAEKIVAAGVRFHAVPISGGGTNPFAELKSVAGLLSAFRAHKIELVLSYTPKGNLYGALAAIVGGRQFLPNVSGLGRAFIRRSFITRVVLLLYRATFRRARHVFFQNKEDMAFFIAAGLVKPENAERLPGSGVDLTRFALSAVAEPAAAPRPAHAPVFLLVARMLWDKGIGEYIAAARLVRQRWPDARFRLLGFLDVSNPSAVPRAQVEAWVAEGVVEYLGATDDVRPFLRDADCVVLPSYREGVPRTLLEAAALARPIVTTDAPGCRDTVVDGETGFLCRPADAADLAAKLLLLIDLPLEQRRAMGLRGRAMIERSFDERIVLERYARVVAACAGAAPG